MFTVKHIFCGMDHLYEASGVRSWGFNDPPTENNDPARVPAVYIDDVHRNSVRTLRHGTVYVMNASGATVATFRFGTEDPPAPPLEEGNLIAPA